MFLKGPPGLGGFFLVTDYTDFTNCTDCSNYTDYTDYPDFFLPRIDQAGERLLLEKIAYLVVHSKYCV